MTEHREMVSASSSEFVEEFDKTFQLSDVNAALVSIANITGAIVVEAAAQPDISIHAVKRARSQGAFERTRVEFAQEGDRITARTAVDEDVLVKGVLDWIKGDKSVAEVQYTVRLPAACALHAKTVNGSVRITGLTRKSEANAVNGSVHLKQLSGQVTAGTVNGSLHVESIAGDAELNTVNGSLDIRDGRVKMLDARTVSGNLRAQLSLDPEGEYRFSSTNGSCEVLIPPDSRCTISMQAVNGGVQVDLPHHTVSSEMRPAFSRWAGEVNGGGAPIRFKTVNGRLRVGSDGASANHGEPAREERATQAEPARNTPSDASNAMDILRAVERGELSVAEAMQRIKSQKTYHV